jgi:hypothetical protein
MNNKQQIVDALNRKYACTLPIEVVEMAVSAGFTSWQTLAAEAEIDLSRPVTVLGLPVRLDATLCDENEIFFESKDGTAVKVFP